MHNYHRKKLTQVEIRELDAIAQQRTNRQERHAANQDEAREALRAALRRRAQTL
jgi:hypothetical protein